MHISQHSEIELPHAILVQLSGFPLKMQPFLTEEPEGLKRLHEARVAFQREPQHLEPWSHID